MADRKVEKAPAEFHNTLKHVNASGKYINGMNTVVKSIDFTASSANIDSGAIYVPANSIITRLSVVTTTELAFATATVGVSFGAASAGATTYTGTLDPDSLIGSGTSCGVGVGNSTDGELNTLLGGQAELAHTAGASDTTAAVEVHGRVIASTGAFTAGTVAFVVEFIYLGGNC